MRIDPVASPASATNSSAPSTLPAVRGPSQPRHQREAGDVDDRIPDPDYDESQVGEGRRRRDGKKSQGQSPQQHADDEAPAQPGDADRPCGHRTAGQTTRAEGSGEPANRGPAQSEDVDGEHGDQDDERAAEQCLGERQDRDAAGRSHPQELGQAAGDVAYHATGAPAGAFRRIGDGEPEQRHCRDSQAASRRGHGRGRGGHGEQAAGQQRPDQGPGVLHHGGDGIRRGEFGWRAHQPGQNGSLERTVGSRERRTGGPGRDDRGRRLAKRGKKRRGRQKNRANAGAPAQQAIAPQPAGDTGEDQRHRHASHGPGSGISSNKCGAARAERVDHERDSACQFARYRHAVAKLDPPHIGELQRVANGSHSALPSRWAPSVRAASADAPKPGGLLRSRRPPGGYRHRSGAAPMAWGGWFAHPEPAPQSRPGWTAGKGAPHPVRGAVGGLTKLAGSPGQEAPRFSLHANILRGTLAVLKTRICSPVDRVAEED